jgi:hypothetical protein
MSMTTSWRPAEPDRAAQDDPAYPRSGAALRAALENVAPPGDEFSRHIAVAVALLNSGALLEAGFPGRQPLLTGPANPFPPHP